MPDERRQPPSVWRFAIRTKDNQVFCNSDQDQGLRDKITDWELKYRFRVPVIDCPVTMPFDYGEAIILVFRSLLTDVASSIHDEFKNCQRLGPNKAWGGALKGSDSADASRG